MSASLLTPPRNDSGDIFISFAELGEVSIVLLEGVDHRFVNPILADVAGEVIVALHCVGVPSEAPVVAHALDHVLLVVRGAHPRVSLGNPELRHILGAGARRAELDELIHDARIDLRERDASGRRPIGVPSDADVRVTRSMLARCTEAVKEAGQILCSFPRS